MAIQFFPINGSHPKLDYQKLEESAKTAFGNHCHEATVAVMNDFPLQVAPESDIDYMLVIAINKYSGNYCQIHHSNGDKFSYLHNLVIPVYHLSDYSEGGLYLQNNELLSQNGVIDYSTQLNALRYQLRNYLQKRCGFSGSVFIHPLLFIESPQYAYINQQAIIGATLDFHAIVQWLSSHPRTIFRTYSFWTSNPGYGGIVEELKRVIEQASKDSKYGYLTKQKIQRIAEQRRVKDQLKPHLGKKMLLISGKAGSGKTTELLALQVQALEEGNNTLFLTYNHLLVNDITKYIQPYRRSFSDRSSAAVMTLHKFFFHFSRSIIVIYIVKKERIVQLVKILESRLKILALYVTNEDLSKISKDKANKKNKIPQDEISTTERLIGKIQSDQILDKGTKREGIDLVNFLTRNFRLPLEKAFEAYFKKKRLAITEMEANEVFLNDYYNILEETLLLIKDPDQFFEKYDVENLPKYLVNFPVGSGIYSKKDGKIVLPELKKFLERRIGWFRDKIDIIFVDEGQDCHQSEKEILGMIVAPEKMVVSSGGKEQLIRHIELCDWKRIGQKPTEPKTKNKRAKSYRLKPQLADFCNFISERFLAQSLNLEPFETPDTGEIIFDFREGYRYDPVEPFFSLLTKGSLVGCSSYESILVLTQSVEKKENSEPVIAGQKQNVSVDEYGHVKVNTEGTSEKWQYVKVIQDHLKDADQSIREFKLYDGTKKDKRDMTMPYPDDIRLIYYESCRGLEAWSVMCFDLDSFFERKYNHKDAEQFLIDVEKGGQSMNAFITNEDRKKMYAATWALMALTRAVDTLYIKIKNPNSMFGKVVQEYISQTHQNIRVYK